MSEKGCVFELSTEFKIWEDFLHSLTKGSISNDLLRRITKQILNVSIEHALNSKLVSYFKSKLDLEEAVLAIVQEVITEPLNRKAIQELDDFIYETNQEMTARLVEMFHDVDWEYALWSTRQLSNTIALVEFLGDFRIIEWHERNKIPYKQSADVKYEFSLGGLYKQLDVLLAPYRGRYAGKYFNKCLDHLVRNMVEDAVFLENNKVETAENSLSYHLGKIKLTDFVFTRRELENYFPLMSETDVNSILIDVENTLQNELLVVINTTLSVDDVRQWFINDKVLTVVVDKPIVKVDFGERLKDDIRASIANGDWVPPKLRTLADNM